MRLLLLLSIVTGEAGLNLRDVNVLFYPCWLRHNIQNIINAKKSPVQLKTQNLHWKFLDTCLKISRYHCSLIVYFLHRFFFLDACNCLGISVKE